MWDVFGAIVAFAGGTLVATINYLISKRALGKKPNAFAVVFIIRQAINVAYILGAYFLAPITTFNTWYFVIGAVMGATLPSIFFTKKLLATSNKFEEKNNVENTVEQTSKENQNGSK